jgi:hypothetical protein
MTALSVYGALRHQRDPREAQLLRERVERAMLRPLDSRNDRQLVQQLSRELQVGEDLVATQVSAVRLRVANRMVDRVRERAIAEGLSPTSAARLSSLSGVQALALATRDALARARSKQQQRLGHEQRVSSLLESEQHAALMQRFEQDDELLAHDFEDAVQELMEDEHRQPRMAA